MVEKFFESREIVCVPCPDPDCDEKYDVTIIGKIEEKLSNSCEGCDKRIYVFEGGSDPYARSFTIKSGAGNPTEYKQRYKRVDLEKGIWKSL